MPKLLRKYKTFSGSLRSHIIAKRFKIDNSNPDRGFSGILFYKLINQVLFSFSELMFFYYTHVSEKR